MASISEIINRENALEPNIWLYREGFFWKAYQFSAYRVLARRKNLMLKKKQIKTVSCEVVSLGFPETTLGRLFSCEEVELVTEKLIRIPDKEIDLQAYEAWFASILVAEQAALPSAEQPVREGVNDILRRIKEFRLEESTPIDCVRFLVSIRKELTMYGNL